MTALVCPRCQAELDPAVGVCPKCGAPARSSGSGSEPPWRQQIRETVERRKQLRKRQLAKRDEDGKQLSIFPDTSEPIEKEENDPVQKRRAEIRARVEEKLAKPRRSPEPHDAGEVTIPFGATSAMAATAPELDTPLTQVDAPEPMEESSKEPEHFLDASLEEPEASDFASPGERVLAGLIDVGIVTLMLFTLLYFTSQVSGHPLRNLPGSAQAALGVIGTLLVAGYFVFFWGLSGQTMGKLLTGSRVVSQQGGPLGLTRAMMRVFGLTLSLVPLGAGLVGLWSDHQRRGWHDRLASSKVIRA